MSAQWFDYPCPDCDSSLTVHEEFCDFEGVERFKIEQAYIDILGILTRAEAVRDVHVADSSTAQAAFDTSFEWLRDQVNDDSIERGWSSLHTACLHALKRRMHVVENDDTGNLRHLRPEDRPTQREPYFGDIELIYEYGACDGCLDTGVCSMVSWCEMQDFTWTETREFVDEWLVETGTWERGSFQESSRDELIANKRHVYDDGVGWSTFASSTVRTMQSNGYIPDNAT